jgi:hypothetical protein
MDESEQTSQQQLTSKNEEWIDADCRLKNNSSQHKH